MLQRKERGQHLQKGLDLVQPPSLMRQLCNHLLLFQKFHSMVKPQTDAPETRPSPLEKAQVCESTPWPGAGRMLGNLFKDRNWLLPPNYLNNDCKEATIPKSLIKEEPKTGEQSVSLNAEKCGWGSNCPFCKSQEKEDWMANTKVNLNRRFHPCQKYKDPKQDILKP